MLTCWGRALRCAPPVLLALHAGAALAQPVEAPPSFNAAQLRGIDRVGPNYTVQTPVRSDGLIRHFVLATPYGEIQVPGDAMLRMRLNELVALSLLEKVSSSDTFARSLVEAGLNPLKYTGRLIANPIGTVQSTLGGIGAMFGRIGSGLNNAGKTQDDALAGLLGVTSERRILAAAYGVDPYTDFAPLDAKLKQLSEAAALGGLAVTGALLAVPGAAGIVVSNLSTANKLDNIAISDLARQYTAAQILDLNRARLTAMGVAPEVNAAILANRNYTPIDMAAMVAALDSMTDLAGRDVFIDRAAAADTRATAYFMRRLAELMAADFRKRGYARIVALGGLPFAIARDGRIVTVAPIDALSWTRESAARFAQFTAERKALSAKAAGELRITGQATVLARKQLKADGWSVVEGQTQ
ncbi:MAG: hypothetical protein Q8M24_07550 [Pseudolabrys sp.]|nr:hypothetical protein [Pseudolabrys sp.]MDP2295305.1 hypothetical protein [Pseudolabrys sp.]